MAPPLVERNREREGRSRASSASWVLAGRAWVRDRLQPVEIGIDDIGRIVRIGRSIPGIERHDVGDSIILPSATDLHVHFREPGPPGADENLATGTQQAALGGVGLVADMPNNVPAVASVNRVAEKIDRARGRLAVDLLIYALARESRTITRLAQVAGAFKLFLAPTSEAEDAPAPEVVRAILGAVATSGLPLSVHAEDPRKFRAIGPIRDLEDWDHHRPVAAEMGGVSELVPNPESLRLHVAHVTAARVAEMVATSANSFEVTPHHLLLSSRSAPDTHRKVNPPLRSERERAELWEWFRSGRVPCLASDHAPHPPSLKDLAFARAPSGMPGVETMLPLLLAEVRSSNLDFATLLRAACDRPARWLGMPQGQLAVGYRANLLVVDFRARVSLAARHLHAPCGWTAFEGWEAIFPVEHYLDGRRLVAAGEFQGTSTGRVVRPEYAPGMSPSVPIAPAETGRR
ncbi:MAG: dihydroorotase family protein [Thermoplasmata archaeon]